jgi:hypothetical protein
MADDRSKLSFYFPKASTLEDGPEWRGNQGPAVKTPLPVKRPVGRPKSIAVSGNMNVTDVDDRDSILETPPNGTAADTVECQTDSHETPLRKLPGKRRGKYKSYSQAEKQEILELVNMCGLRATAEKYKITPSTICTWKKSFRENPDSPSNRSKLKKGSRTPGGGRKVGYGDERDMEILTWVLEQRDDQLPVSRKSIQAYALSLLRDTHPDFKASEGWVRCFMRRHNLTLRCKTSVSQKLPEDLEVRLAVFYKRLRETREQMDFDDDYIINMDEVPMYFELIPGKTVTSKGQKDVKILSTGGEKRHFTLVLSITASGKFLPSTVVFKGTVYCRMF